MELNSHISVDCVVFGYDAEQLYVLLVERTLNEIDKGLASDWTLTGNHVFEGETIENAAHRVLHDLTGFTDVYLEQFRTFAHPDRLLKSVDQQWMKHIGLDPTRRVVTVGYLALLNTQQVNLQWMGRKVAWTPVKEVGNLAFDHNLILTEALKALREKMKHEPIGFELLPEKFTLTQLQTVYEQIFDAQFDKRNFRKKVNRMTYVIPLNEKQKGVRHKPAQLFMFSREVFDKTRKELFDFLI